MRLSVIIPAYREVKNIAAVIHRIRVAADALDGWDVEIFVVDDGSDDGTAVEAARAASSHPDVRVICHPDNRGKGAAVRTALEHATGKWVLVQDADLEYDPDDYAKLLAATPDVDAVFGSRFKARAWPEGMKLAHFVANRILTTVANALYGLALTDEATCYKLVRTELLRAFALEADRFDLCPEIVAKLGLVSARLVEVPVSYRARSRAQGKKIGWRDGVAALAVLWKLRPRGTSWDVARVTATPVPASQAPRRPGEVDHGAERVLLVAFFAAHVDPGAGDPPTDRPSEAQPETPVIPAESDDTAPGAGAETPAPAETVVRQAKPRTAASSSTVRDRDFLLRPHLRSTDILSSVPGFFVVQHAGGGKANQYFLRGFDADHGTDVLLSVDGVPVNNPSHGHGQGYADLHFVIPELVKRVDVKKGPYFADVGDFATAGAVDLVTAPHIDGSSVTLRTAGFLTDDVARAPLRTARALLMVAPDVSEVHPFFAAEVFANDGPFENPERLQRFNLFGRAPSISVDSAG